MTYDISKDLGVWYILGFSPEIYNVSSETLKRSRKRFTEHMKAISMGIVFLSRFIPFNRRVLFGNSATWSQLQSINTTNITILMMAFKWPMRPSPQKFRSSLSNLRKAHLAPNTSATGELLRRAARAAWQRAFDLALTTFRNAHARRGIVKSGCSSSYLPTCTSGRARRMLFTRTGARAVECCTHM